MKKRTLSLFVLLYSFSTCAMENSRLLDRTSSEKNAEMNFCQKTLINVFGWPCCCCLCCMDENGTPAPIRKIHKWCCGMEEDEEQTPSITEYFLTGGTGIVCFAALATAGII